MTAGKIDALKKLYDEVLLVNEAESINEWAEEDREEFKREFEELQRKLEKQSKKVRSIIDLIKEGKL